MLTNKRKRRIRSYSGRDSWLQKYWRPMMAVTYMIIIIFDFIIGPIFWSLLQFYSGHGMVTQWVPLTLTSGGIFHAAMGAVLGISAFTRGQEKIQRVIYGTDTNTYNPNIINNQPIQPIIPTPSYNPVPNPNPIQPPITPSQPTQPINGNQPIL